MFEKLFFRMDEDHSGTISLEEASLFLSFVALDLDVAERMTAFNRASMGVEPAPPCCLLDPC